MSVTQQTKVRRQRKSDPFLQLSDDTLKIPDQPNPSSNDENGPSHRSESLIADVKLASFGQFEMHGALTQIQLVLTPINMISFILSLFLVDRQQRQWRLSQHAPPKASSFWLQFGFQNPEPYQDSIGTTWHPHLSWRRRGVAKAQMSNVFDMRGRVIVALVAWTLVGFLAVAYVVRRMYHWAVQ